MPAIQTAAMYNIAHACYLNQHVVISNGTDNQQRNANKYNNYNDNMTKSKIDQKKILKELITINSIYPNEKKITNFLFSFFKKKGYDVYRQRFKKGRENIIVEKGTGKKVIVLYAHLDTVNYASEWNTNPFKLTIKGDRAYGLGAWDMKGGAAINILTFLNYHPWTFKLRLIFCIDEENISQGGHAILKSKYMDDVKCIISTEPALHANGIRGIVTGRPGRAVYKVRVSGFPKHVAFYEQKYDIHYVASLFIQSVEKLNTVVRGKKQMMFVRAVQSRAEGISTPSLCELELDSYIVNPTTHASQLNVLQKIASQFRKKYPHFYIDVTLPERTTPYLEAYENKKNTYQDKLMKSIQSVTKQKALPYYRMSVADENVFGSHGYTVLGIGPEGGNAHAPNEWVSLASLKKLYTILNDFLNRCDQSTL